MKYQIQKRTFEAVDTPVQGARLLGQVNDLKTENASLTKEAKALRTEMQELRTSFTALGKRVDTLQTESASFRKEINQVSSCISQFNDHLDAMAKAMQESTAALSRAAQAMEDQQQRERQQQKETAEALQQQRQEQQALSLAMKQNRQRVCEQLDRLGQQETQLQQRATEAMGALTEQLHKLGRQTHERIDALCAGVQRMTQEEAAALGQMSEGFRKVQDCEKGLSELLVGVNATLGGLTRHSEQVLVEDRQIRTDHQLGEAARLNAVGLKCLADGRHEEAVRSFERARDCAPAAFEPAFNLATAHLRLGHTDAARVLVNELSAAFPDRNELQFLRGVVNLAARDFAAARDQLGPAAESEARSDTALTAAGLAHLFSGDARSASAALRQAAGSSRPEMQFLREIGFTPAPAA